MPALMDALATQTLPRADVEVLLVDDCSTDGTGEAAAATGVPVVLRTPRNGGAYAARNLGLAHARGGVVAITDADCVPSPRWLERALDRLDAGADVVGGHIDVPLRARPSLAELVDVARYLDQERMLREAGFVATANLVARRAAFERVGVFNHQVISGGDREWCLRAAAAGLHIAYAGDATVVHRPRTTARGLVRKCRRMGEGRAQLNAHGDPLARRPMIWRRPGAYLPRPGLYGVERLVDRGVPLGRRRMWQLAATEWALVQLPLVWGSAVGSWRVARS
jgi:glycosyltransferase involved in cell wall biosynthesis